MQQDIIQTIAQYRWHALAALLVVVMVHGWVLGELPLSNQWLSGSINVPIVPYSSLGCEPLYQYASDQGDAVITAYGGDDSYTWEAPDADALYVSDNVAIARYHQTDTSTHIVIVSSGGKQTQCLVIVPE